MFIAQKSSGFKASPEALAEIAGKFPQFSPKQITWLASVCCDPEVDDMAKLVAAVMCEEAGPLLDFVEISDRELTKRVNKLIKKAKFEVGNE